MPLTLKLTHVTLFYLGESTDNDMRSHFWCLSTAPQLQGSPSCLYIPLGVVWGLTMILHVGLLHLAIHCRDDFFPCCHDSACSFPR